MRTSFNNLLQFDRCAGNYMKRHPEETKLGYAIKKVGAKIAIISHRFNESIGQIYDDIRIDHCLTDPPDDPKGKILRDSAGAYVFSREGEKACLKAIREAKAKALDTDDIEVEPFFVAHVPDDLTDEELEAFSGLVVKPDVAQGLLDAREKDSSRRDT